MLLTTGKNLNRMFSIIPSQIGCLGNQTLLTMFLATIGEEAYNEYDGLKFDGDEDKMDLGIVIKKFEEYFAGKTHKVYEFYKFPLWKQEASESIGSYTTALQ